MRLWRIRGAVSFTDDVVVDDILSAEGTTFHIDNSIVAGNINGDCAGNIVTRGHNLAGDDSCNLTDPTDLPPGNPLLGPLGDYGGATRTYPLLWDSPALETGSCTDPDGQPVTVDQRGIARPQAAACDIGAYEAAPIVLRLDYRYWMADGERGAGRYTLLAGGSFVDEASQTGVWVDLSPRGVLLQYGSGSACQALSLGRPIGGGRLAGLRLCRDGSGRAGIWTAGSAE